MSDKNTMNEHEPMTLDRIAIQSMEEAYQASQGIKDEDKRLEVIKYVESIHRRLVQEQYGVTPPEARRGLFGELESDF